MVIFFRIRTFAYFLVCQEGSRKHLKALWHEFFTLWIAFQAYQEASLKQDMAVKPHRSITGED
jgi:hypothetical protein